MNDEPTSPRRTPGAGRLIALAILVLVVGLAAWLGWAWWQARGEGRRDEQAMTVQRLEALEARAEALRRDQRAQAQRLLDAAATNRVLRDEVLGLGQRGALLEESVARLTDPDRHGAQALRLDEVELLLSLAAQRLEIAHDPAGARRAYALAAGVLDGLDDHRLLNLKQALAQERVAVDALGAGARADAFARLDSLADAIAGLPRQAPTAAPGQVRPAWQRWLAPLVDVRPSRDTTLVAPDQRAAADVALQIEIGLARAALERGDDTAYRAALARVDGWLPRLWPDSPARRQVHARLRTLQQAQAPARPAEVGSTLQQLRALRSAGMRLRPTMETPEVTP
ncbi:uroporphyrinogen-III C-methyltransferase [Pseudoxanthomonas mexicana]|uniref:uroporphyrinogen-III C-methyltransferase n=1 Tax=Pseudoxanthomonas mexicana TaxID=128785 RepID=UPI002899837A|nr:uroporphyrinogen-III C-methyltransferase [Pseudoxanthomonas mexicana]